MVYIKTTFIHIILSKFRVAVHCDLCWATGTVGVKYCYRVMQGSVIVGHYLAKNEFADTCIHTCMYTKSLKVIMYMVCTLLSFRVNMEGWSSDCDKHSCVANIQGSAGYSEMQKCGS